MVRMRRLEWSLGLAVLVAGCSTTPERDGVPAVRFRQIYAASTMDAMHGGAVWCDTLCLPEPGVVAQVRWDPSIDLEAREVRDVPEMHAWHDRIEDTLTALARDPHGQPPPENITLPSSLARSIVALAERTDEQSRMMQEFGRAAVAAGVVGGSSSMQQADLSSLTK